MCTLEKNKQIEALVKEIVFYHLDTSIEIIDGRKEQVDESLIEKYTNERTKGLVELVDKLLHISVPEHKSYRQTGNNQTD